MDKFAGIKLNNLHLQDASFRTLRNARSVFIKQYSQHLGAPQNFSIIKHLRNYIEIPKVQTLSTTEDLAVALKFIPDDSRAAILTKDDKIVALLKNTIAANGYRLADIKPLLNFKGDWFDSVYDISQAVRRKNLAQAYELLDQLVKLDQNNPYNIGLQLAYYIEILDFLLEHIGRNNLIDFYSLVENEYNISLNRLMALPDVDPEICRSKRLSWSCLGGCANKAVSIRSSLTP